MKTLKEAQTFVAHLRIIGIEATCRAWGKNKNWVCVHIGDADFLWDPEGSYDGWEMFLGDKTDAYVKGVLDAAESVGSGGILDLIVGDDE